MMAADAMTGTTESFVNDERESNPDLVLLAAIRAVLEGDRDAFQTIMVRSERRVASVAWRILGDAEDVREALQETYLRVYHHLGKYDEQRDFFAWLFRISVNVCRDIDRHRRARHDRFTELNGLEAMAGNDDPDDAFVRSEEIALLTRAIDALPPKERLALILRDIEGLSTEEVAEVLGSRQSTVRVQISSARTRVRAMLDRWIGGGKS